MPLAATHNHRRRVRAVSLFHPAQAPDAAKNHRQQQFFRSISCDTIEATVLTVENKVAELQQQQQQQIFRTRSFMENEQTCPDLWTLKRVNAFAEDDDEEALGEARDDDHGDAPMAREAGRTDEQVLEWSHAVSSSTDWDMMTMQ
jgi:hypothetical protein